MKEFDLTPDPKVLIALTHTPLQPLDALCELIDNALDSFQVAKLNGEPIQFPLINIELPGASEINRGDGAIRITDNGPGLTAELTEKALRAGYSGNKPYGSLGLFGMGFNISTGKLGKTTKFMTTRKPDYQAIQATIDLIQLQEKRTYKVPVLSVDKPKEFPHGTLVEISGWWPDGNPNNGFLRKLISYGRPNIRREIGRRYATILLKDKVRILVNGEPCDSFEHCVWDKSRSVERRNHGTIPAVFEFDEVVAFQTRCATCHDLIPQGEKVCPTCHSQSFRTLEERIKGWVGIQRFDDMTEFGIDLIRNGRAIRIAEKTAFFEFTDEFKKTEKDYPIDQPYGRIVGEVHLDHVPVDFLKQDFQRSSPEWQRVMSFLRGDSSLQPNKPNAESNHSPVFKLFQGYRRVRVPGKSDMYMGVYDEPHPRRVSRDLEKEYYEKFKAKLPGYYDDAEWYKLVEQADKRPLPQLVECPSCQGQNLKEQEQCQVCGHVLLGKSCLNSECGKLIPKSAVSCPHCGKSQVPKIETPWGCQVCYEANRADVEICSRCGKPRGTEHPASENYLLENSDKDDNLSLPGCSVELADGQYSVPIDVVTYVTRAVPITPSWEGKPVPVLAFKGQTISVFLDKSHPVFRSYRVRPEVLIADEVAHFLYENNRRLLGQSNSGAHTISNLAWLVLQRRWADALEDTPNDIKEDIRSLFDTIRTRLLSLAGEKAQDIFDDLTETQKKSLVDRMIGRNIDIGKLSQMKATGEFLAYIDEDTVVDVFRKIPAIFFDGAVWNVAYQTISDLPETVIKDAQDRIKAKHQNCLEDCAGFLRQDSPEILIAQRARASVDYLSGGVG